MPTTLESIVADFDELGKYIETETAMCRTEVGIGFMPKQMAGNEPIMTGRNHDFEFIYSTAHDVSVRVTEKITPTVTLSTTFSVLDGIARVVEMVNIDAECTHVERNHVTKKWPWVKEAGVHILEGKKALVVGSYMLECLLANMTSANVEE